MFDGIAKVPVHTELTVQRIQRKREREMCTPCLFKEREMAPYVWHMEL